MRLIKPYSYNMEALELKGWTLFPMTVSIKLLTWTKEAPFSII